MKSKCSSSWVACDRHVAGVPDDGVVLCVGAGDVQPVGVEEEVVAVAVHEPVGVADGRGVRALAQPVLPEGTELRPHLGR